MEGRDKEDEEKTRPHRFGYQRHVSQRHISQRPMQAQSSLLEQFSTTSVTNPHIRGRQPSSPVRSFGIDDKKLVSHQHSRYTSNTEDSGDTLLNQFGYISKGHKASYHRSFPSKTREPHAAITSDRKKHTKSVFSENSSSRVQSMTPRSTQQVFPQKELTLFSTQKREAKIYQDSHEGSLSSSNKAPKKTYRSSSQYPERDRSWIVQPFRVNELLSLASKTADEIVSSLHNDLKVFLRTLQIAQPNTMHCIMLLLFKISECMNRSNETNSKAALLFAEVLSTRCPNFQFNLKLYVTRDILQCKQCTCRVNIITHNILECQIQNLYMFFRTLLDTIPSVVWTSLPIEEFIQSVRIVKAKLSSELVCKVEELEQIQTKARNSYGQSTTSISPNFSQLTWDNSKYRELPIFPEWQELCAPNPPEKLRANIIRGSYTDWMHYYDVQFRLLREDFIAPLRRGICDYLYSNKAKKGHDVRVYREAKLLEPFTSREGMCYKVQFDNSYLKHCKWEHSKRFLFGSLLCFSPDQFKQTVLFAIVINRDPKELFEGIVDVLFQGTIPMLRFLSERYNFTIVESTAYFEASRHTMSSIQTAETETMPFTNYLIHNKCDIVEAPHYLMREEKILYDLKCVYREPESNHVRSKHHIFPKQVIADEVIEELGSDDDEDECVLFDSINMARWPLVEDTILDTSQLVAFKMALSQEIAVIQGPPGTGKTFMGIKIAQTLVINRKQWDPKRQSPILVVCYTNHALDQFLEGILSVMTTESQASIKSSKVPKIVRIGGRTKSETISRLNIHQHRRNVFLPADAIQQRAEAEKLFRTKEDDVTIKLMELNRVRTSFLSFKELEVIMLRKPNHHYQLLSAAVTTEERDKVLEVWLGLWKVNRETDVNNKATQRLNHDIQETSFEDNSLKKSLLPEDVDQQHLSEKGESAHNFIENYDHQSESNEVESKLDNASQDSSVHQTSQETSFSFERASAEPDSSNQTNTDSSDGDENSLIDVEGEALLENYARILDDQIDAVHNPHVIEWQRGNQTFKTSVPEVSSNFLYVSEEYDSLLIEGIRKGTFSESQVEELEDSSIHLLDNNYRWKLYNYWREKYIQQIRDQCEAKIQEYSEACQEVKRAQLNADRYTLETADIIGMTTTGAAKYQHIIHMVKPKIVIVEEAAEVLESHIVSSLSAGTQHLILIGDHKQLKPKPNEYNLSKKYNLDISLFERLIQNQFPHATLTVQHRMRPEIANLVRPHIYTCLIDHESVLKYSDVRGVQSNLFFIDHDNPETHDDNLLSHSNRHEAEYTVALCKYLLQQGYEAEQITILVTYTGQLLLLKSLMPRNIFHGVLVRTVDNYQGEENDLILLSLVRSNKENNVGFLREDNRVCVALSRAKVGFFCIGNFKLLRQQSDLWERLVKDLEVKNLIGDALKLCCNNHPANVFSVRFPDDFSKNAPDGGCLQDCQFRLKCGHVCTRKCHSYDVDHTQYKCKKRCARTCPQGHNCPKYCTEDCGDCAERVSKVIPTCGHSNLMLCFQSPEDFQCKWPCEKLCPSKHPCTNLCYKKCKCLVKVPKIIPGCKHIQLVPCFQDPSTFSCYADCDRKCNQGHLCQNRCYKLCGECNVMVKEHLQDCSHTVEIPCFRRGLRVHCTMPCMKVLNCGHPCQKRCGEVCSNDCNIIITVSLRCEHKIQMPCYKGMFVWLYPDCIKKCKKLLSCKHPCTKLCSQPCTDQCMFVVNKVWPCGHKLKRKCYQTDKPEKFPCQKKCELKLPCEHTCANKCGEKCSVKCIIEVLKVLPCGHKRILPCHIEPKTTECRAFCSATLKCGHICSGMCKDCTIKRYHLPCKYSLELQRFCGHKLSVQCIDMDDAQHRAKFKHCLLQCIHGACTKECTVSCTPCDKLCPWNCPHFSCTKLCHETCNRPPCNEPCSLKLECGHPCPGVCGEPCLSTCPTCHSKQFNKLVSESRGFHQDKLYIQLNCNHIFMMEYLDKYVFDRTRRNALILPISCPKCKNPLLLNYRYGNVCKRFLSDKIAVEETIHQVTSISMRQTFMLTLRLEKLKDCNISESGMRPDSDKPHKVLSHQTKYIQKLLSQLNGENTHDIGPQEKYLIILLINAIEHSNAFAETYLGDIHQSEVSTVDITAQLSTFIEILFQLKHRKPRLSVQVVQDITSELFRLSLMVQLFKMESKMNCKKMPSSVPPTVTEPSLEEFLRFLDKRPNYRVSKEEYIKFSKSLQTAHASAVISGSVPIDYMEVVKDVRESTPPILKGNWQKCARGHYFCSPLTLVSGHDTVSCPKCQNESVIQ